MNEILVPSLIDIPRIKDARGNLSVIDDQTCLPFQLKRIFYIYDIPAGTVRGGHAHYKLNQFIWSVSGSVSVSTIDVKGVQQNWLLQLPWQGLWIPPMTWAYETSVSAGCVYIVGASDYYQADDYIRDKELFLELIKGSN
jgi:dTDP-4-dehydrorhamnose 3,5-epimerase-like enzyme